ncbi:ATP-binding protein [Streptomyces sp. NPDC001520]|uniref:ATP-binding protein n=1 Tax=Streptomyces sp. NPDC001520 TaxID=3364581 RepID=UPI00367B5D98
MDATRRRSRLRFHARRHVAGTARSWGLPEETTEALETVIGELAANALEHTASRSVAVALALAGCSAVVTVTDEGTGDIPVTALLEGNDEHGCGLFMVAALAHRWGGRRSRGGLTVWAEVVTGTRLPREGAMPAPGSPRTGMAEHHGPPMASPMTKPFAGPSGMTASVP